MGNENGISPVISMTSDPFISDGLITVTRGLHSHSSLVEIWSLRRTYWEEPGKDAILKVWVCDLNDLGRFWVPPNGKSVSDVMNWEDAPKEIRKKFIEAMENINEFKELKHDA